MRRDDISIYVSPANRARFEAIIADRPHMAMSYSKNQEVAKDILSWVHTPANYEKWFISQKGFATPPTAQWETHKLWTQDS